MAQGAQDEAGKQEEELQEQASHAMDRDDEQQPESRSHPSSQAPSSDSNNAHQGVGDEGSPAVKAQTEQKDSTESGGEEEDEADEEGAKGKSTAKKVSKEEDEVTVLARAFFHATTKLSQDIEDILPQEDSSDMKLSVFNIFASLFPEVVGEGGAEAKNKKKRLRFNRIGYQIYGKEQSRRVPAVRAKPGNPGYGFRRARWREPLVDEEDKEHCEKVLKEAGCKDERITEVKDKVQAICRVWDSVRRPSRPAGPGRPRRADTSPQLGPEKPNWASPPSEHQILDESDSAKKNFDNEGSGSGIKELKKDPSAVKIEKHKPTIQATSDTKQGGSSSKISTKEKQNGNGKRPRADGVDSNTLAGVADKEYKHEKEPARKKADTTTKQSPYGLKDPQPPKLPPLALPPLNLSGKQNMDQEGEGGGGEGALPPLRQISGLESLASAALWAHHQSSTPQKSTQNHQKSTHTPDKSLAPHAPSPEALAPKPSALAAPKPSALAAHTPLSTSYSPFDFDKSSPKPLQKNAAQ